MRDMGFDYFARRDPHALTLVDPRGKHWSRGELQGLANRLSRALRAAGLTSGDSVAIISPNCAEYLAVYLAATQVGLYIVPINWHFSLTEIEYIVADSGAKIVFMHERVSTRLASLRTGAGESCRFVTIDTTHSGGSLEAFAGDHSDQPLDHPVLGRTMVYTSATTGRPKGISLPLPESSAALEKVILFHIAVGIELEHNNVHLCASMLYHAAPLEAAATALHMGHVVLLTDQWEPERLLGLIETYGVTTVFAAPMAFVRMLKLPAQVRAGYSVATLRRVVHSGAPCPVDIKRQMIDWWGPLFWDTYGAAEGAGTIAGSADWLRYPGTVGRPIPGSEIRILDDDGNDLPRGEVGTIYLTRYTGDQFQYRGDPEKTRACHRGKFFTVGDTGYLNEEGYLFLHGRRIDLIISGGMNIYAAEIEQVLVLHPQVADCAVFGVPDELLGEVVHAVVLPTAGVTGTPQLTSELLKFLSGRISGAKLPRRMEYTTTLPRDPNGKLFKRLLRERFLAPPSP